MRLGTLIAILYCMKEGNTHSFYSSSIHLFLSYKSDFISNNKINIKYNFVSITEFTLKSW